MPYESSEGGSNPLYKKTNSSSGYLCIPDQNRPDQSNSTPHHHIIKRSAFAKDCLLTGQEQACTLGSFGRLVVTKPKMA